MEMGLLSGLLQLAGLPAWRRFEQATADPDRAQRETWEHVRRKCQDAPFWRERWGGGSPPPLTELPVTDYVDYEAAFDEAFEGDLSPTTGEAITCWLISSNSTGKASKRFPLYADHERRLKAAWEACLYSLAVAVPDIPLQPVLSPYPANIMAPSPAGLPVHFVTAEKLMEWFLDGKQSGNLFPEELVARPDLWDEWAPLYAVAGDASMALAITADRIAVMREDVIAGMDRWWPYLEGRADPPPPLPPLRLSTERLNHLRSVFSGAPPGLRRIWPSMKVVSCWTVASAGAAVPLLEPWLEGARLLDGPYASMETGPVTVPLFDGEEGHPVNPDANVAELLPEGAEPEPRNVIPMSQAEAGRRYELIVTTPGGLIRYRTGDIFVCHGFHHRTPRLTFCSRVAFSLNVSGTVRLPEDAVVKLLMEHGYRLQDDLMLGPHPNGIAIVMYIKEGSGHRPAGHAFDRGLCELSADYASKRRQGLILDIHNMVVPATHPMWARPGRASCPPRRATCSPKLRRTLGQGRPSRIHEIVSFEKLTHGGGAFSGLFQLSEVGRFRNEIVFQRHDFMEIERRQV